MDDYMDVATFVVSVIAAVAAVIGVILTWGILNREKLLRKKILTVLTDGKLTIKQIAAKLEVEEREVSIQVGILHNIGKINHQDEQWYKL